MLRLSVAVVVAPVLVVLALAAPTLAQVPDHLQCYRAHDDVRLHGTVDIDNAQFGLSQDCRIKRTRFFCAPAAKLDVQVNVDPLLPVFAPPAPGDFVCYKATCPNTNLPDQTVTDQFGTRVIKLNRRSFLLCAPAVKGTEFCGDGIKNGSETCDGGDAVSCPGACQPDCTCPGAPTPCATGAPVATPTPLPCVGETPEPCATGTPIETATPLPCDGATPEPCATGTPVPTATPGPRFVDNGDTVTDTQTGLQWEKKVDDKTCDAGGNAGASCTVASECPGGTCSCSGPHCVNNTYLWTGTPGGTTPDGLVFTDFLSPLNGGVTGVGNCTSSDGTAVTIAGFAGHCDWRLPTIQELKTIVDLTQGICGGGDGACIHPILGPTVPSSYCSASTASNPAEVWHASFASGIIEDNSKRSICRARAVRAGS